MDISSNMYSSNPEYLSITFIKLVNWPLFLIFVYRMWHEYSIQGASYIWEQE